MESSYRKSTIETASLRTLSPNTNEYRRGSVLISGEPRIERVATGSTADINEAKVRLCWTPIRRETHDETERCKKKALTTRESHWSWDRRDRSLPYHIERILSQTAQVSWWDGRPLTSLHSYRGYERPQHRKNIDCCKVAKEIPLYHNCQVWEHKTRMHRELVKRLQKIGQVVINEWSWKRIKQV